MTTLMMIKEINKVWPEDPTWLCEQILLQAFHYSWRSMPDEFIESLYHILFDSKSEYIIHNLKNNQ